MPGFYGKYRTTLDDKGRFSLPVKLRNVKSQDDKPILDDHIILTKGLEGCLSLYPEEEWKSIEKRLSSFPFTKKDFRFFIRRFYSSAAAVSPDRSGRILIPSHLIEEAQLKKELLIIGVNWWIEIWNPDIHDEYYNQATESYEDVAERLIRGHGFESE